MEQKEEKDAYLQTETKKQLASELRANSQDLSFDIQKKTITVNKIENVTGSSIGLFGFAISTFFPGLSNLGIVPYDGTFFATYTMFGGLCQYIGGIYSWYRGVNEGAMLAIIFGLYNAVYPLMNAFEKIGVAGPGTSRSIGFFNVSFALFSIPMVPINFKPKYIWFINQALVLLNFIFQFLHNFTEIDGFKKCSGVCSLFVSAFTFYITTALLLINVYEKPILPLY